MKDLTVLRDKEQFTERLVISKVEVLTTVTGNSYLSGECMNKLGVYEFKIWDAEMRDAIIVGTPHEVQGKINIYNGKFGLILDSVRAITEYRMEDYLPSAPLSREQLQEGINRYIEMIQDLSLRTFVTELIKEVEEEFFTYPAAMKVHDGVVGGLAHHTLKVVTNAYNLCNTNPKVNRDIVIAGALIHDIGKTKELTPLPTIEYTIRGNLEGHIVIGLDMMSTSPWKEYVLEDVMVQLRHVIVSHHGQLDWGSPKVPITTEAILVHMADVADSRVTMAQERFTDDELYTEWIKGNRYMNSSLIKSYL